MNAYCVNYYDEDDMMTWVTTVFAETDDDAYLAAEEERLKNSIHPGSTEIYSIENTVTGKTLFLSFRAGAAGTVLPETPSKEELTKLETMSFQNNHAQKMLFALENDPSYPSDQHEKAVSECEKSENEIENYLKFLTARYPGYKFEL
ncbi:MAG: hypothetical protein NTX65_15340 [Ignavibacteriales bacterium]|nr:hypothetical protein [Ignavibacteriales bacterium]